MTQYTPPTPIPRSPSRRRPGSFLPTGSSGGQAGDTYLPPPARVSRSVSSPAAPVEPETANSPTSSTSSPFNQPTAGQQGDVSIIVSHGAPAIPRKLTKMAPQTHSMHTQTDPVDIGVALGQRASVQPVSSRSDAVVTATDHKSSTIEEKLTDGPLINHDDEDSGSLQQVCGKYVFQSTNSCTWG